jgi:hypothetical protein
MIRGLEAGTRAAVVISECQPAQTMDDLQGQMALGVATPAAGTVA